MTATDDKGRNDQVTVGYVTGNRPTSYEGECMFALGTMSRGVFKIDLGMHLTMPVIVSNDKALYKI